MYEQELEWAKEAAKAAGDFLRERKKMHVNAADGKDIKLSSDINSEKIILDLLHKTGIPILSEESKESKESEENAESEKSGRMGMPEDENGRLWIVDPLDGTANYWKGMQELSCVSVALMENDQPVLGVVYRFAVDELYYGAVGAGAFLNDKPIHTSGVSQTGQAVAAAGFPVHRDYDDKSLAVFIRQVQKFKKIRMLGTAAVMGAFVAAGKIDAYMEEGIMLWDVAGAAALVLAAGGKARIDRLKDEQCICQLFANQELMEDYDAESL